MVITVLLRFIAIIYKNSVEMVSNTGLDFSRTKRMRKMSGHL